MIDVLAGYVIVGILVVLLTYVVVVVPVLVADCLLTMITAWRRR